MTAPAEGVWGEAQAEIARALALHGEKSMHAAPAMAERRIRIALEEFGEVAKEFNDADIQNRPVDRVKVRAELMQTLSLLGGWVQAIDQEAS